MAQGIYSGSITLASVSDGQSGKTLYTWIRYADDGQGTNISPTPTATTQYIGIANNKETSTASDDPSDYTWSKYVGKDGVATVYDIRANHDKVYKFYSSTEGLQFSPSTLQLSVYQTVNGATSLMALSEYSTDIEVIGVDYNIPHLWNLLNSITVIKPDGTQVTSILNDIRTLDTTNKQITFHFGNLLQYTMPESDTSENAILFRKLTASLSNDNIYFIYKIFSYTTSLTPSINTLLELKPIALEFGTNAEMAKFGVTATSINAAVQDAKFRFDADGLTVAGGAFTITEDGEELLKYDPSQQALRIKGSGEFTGAIHATEGSFSGDVSADTLTANSGDIGSFIIESDGLYSKNGAEQEDGSYDTSKSSIKLLGENGQIDAENINLGVGAHINKYIQLGSASLWNPEDEEANGKILDAGATSLSQTGVLKLGNITLDGPESKISGVSFSITPDKTTFNNIVATGKISTAVFEQGHIQSVGGAMVFKPSYKIQTQNGNVITLDTEFKGLVNNKVILINSDGGRVADTTITAISDDKLSVTIDTTGISISSVLFSLIDVGPEDDLVIGINSEDSEMNGLLLARGLSIFENNSHNQPKLFLGDLASVGFNGFGLYSENVYLTGSLTTKVENSTEATYAGVNTFNGTTAIKFDDDNSRIIFWAGSQDRTDESIQSAPFQITEQGSLYAQKGIFEGAIISKSTIEGVDIYAARIHGSNDTDGEAGLSFYDNKKGIIFYNGDTSRDPQSTETEVFSLGVDGFTHNTTQFIGFDNNGVIFTGERVSSNDYFTKDSDGYLHLNGQKLGWEFATEGATVEVGAIEYNNDKIKLSLQNQNQIEIGSNEMDLNNVVKMRDTVLYGETMKYEHVSNGYNLYVFEEV